MDQIDFGQHDHYDLLANWYHERDQFARQHGRTGNGNCRDRVGLSHFEFHCEQPTDGSGDDGGIRGGVGWISDLQLISGFDLHGRLWIDVHRIFSGQRRARESSRWKIAQFCARDRSADPGSLHSDFRYDVRDDPAQALRACRLERRSRSHLASFGSPRPV